MAAEAAGGGGTPVVPEAEEPQLQPAGNRSACASNMSRKRKAEADQEVQEQEKQDVKNTDEPQNTSHLAGGASGGASASSGGNIMDPSAAGMIGARDTDEKGKGVAEHRSRWEALLSSFNFTPEQEAELPAIRQGAERLFSDYEELWRMAEPGKPLSEMPPIPVPDFSRFSNFYKGPDDDEAFSGSYGDLARNGQDLVAEIGPFMLLKKFAGVSPSLPKWVAPPASLGCDIPWEEPDLSTPAGVAAMEKMKEEIEAWRNS